MTIAIGVILAVAIGLLIRNASRGSGPDVGVDQEGLDFVLFDASGGDEGAHHNCAHPDAGTSHGFHDAGSYGADMGHSFHGGSDGGGHHH